jgi:dienelactone hydrolase
LFKASVRRGIFAAVLAGGTSWAATPESATPASVPTGAFFKPEVFARPALSPDGKWLAVLAPGPLGRRQLAIFETADFRNVKVIATFDSVDVYSVSWLDANRLLFSAADEQAAAEDRANGGRFAMDRDGQNGMLLNLFGRDISSTVYRNPRKGLGEVERILDDGTGDVITSYWKWKHLEWNDSYPERYDTRTGRTTALFQGQIPLGIQYWVADSKGALRAAMGIVAGDTFMLAAQPDGTWSERARFKSLSTRGDAFSIHSIAVDGQAYAIRATGDAARSKGVYRLDLTSGRTDPEPLLSAHGFDINPHFVENARTHQVVGAHFMTDAASTAWFDPDLRALQTRVDDLLPGLSNRIDVPSCGCSDFVMVTSSSDRQPPVYLLFDRATRKLTQIGSERPDISPLQMAMTDFYRIKARDGLEIPVYVTKPQGKGPFPTVVLVHGGPWERGWDWSWDGESQFLASRGYLVVKPEFRGSIGYGETLADAGMKQWGLKMQDDIADATIWAAKQGWAIAARTCIAGASYGGYATLMGLVRYPDLYRCGVASSAVSDIDLMYDITWSDFSDQYKKFGMPLLVGDQDKDAEQLKATSPIRQAARISRPLLLAHGRLDARVPVEHAYKLKRALESHDAPLTWIEYPDEAHGWYKPANRVDFYDRMVKFLDANIGPDAKH